MAHGHRPPRPIVGDRNTRALRGHQHTQFVERVRAGLVQPLDRFSKPMAVGDHVMWRPQIDPRCQVLIIEAAPLDQQPPEASTVVHVTLGVSVREPMDVRGPAVYFVHIETPVAEATPAAAGDNPPSDSPISGAPDPAPPAEADPAEPPDDHTD